MFVRVLNTPLFPAVYFSSILMMTFQQKVRLALENYFNNI